MDDNFSWKSHVMAILSKATQRLYFLKLLNRAGVPRAQLLHLYLAVILANSIIPGPSLAPFA